MTEAIRRQISLAVEYAPKHYPQYTGKLERFFRTTRQEMLRAVTPELAGPLHDVWIMDYNHHRLHSSVVDAQGHVHVPQFRFTWKPSAAKPLPPGLDREQVFQVQRPQTSADTRQVTADQSISYKKHRYHFPHLHKGDVVQGKEHTDQIQFFYQDQLVHTVVKPPAVRRLVHAR